MAEETFSPFRAEVLDVKGDLLAVSCYDSGGLCGFFYHDIFPNLSVMQFGGKYPWASADELVVECPDRGNAVTLKITRA